MALARGLLLLCISALAVLPECQGVEQDNVTSFPDDDNSTGLVVSAMTGTLECDRGYYTNCSAPPCTNGRGNNATTTQTKVNGTALRSKLLRCEEFSQIQCGSAIYLTGTTSDLNSSRQACLNASSVLMNDLYLGTLSAQERGCVLNRSNPVWLLDSTGRGEVFDPQDGVQGFIRPSNGPYDFVCLPSNYAQLLATLTPDVNTTGEVHTCRTMTESYVCDARVILGEKQLNLCLPRCMHQAPAEPTSRFYCNGFNVTFQLKSVPVSVAAAKCLAQENRMLRFKDFRRLNRSLCFRDKLDELTKTGKGTFWLRFNTRGSRGSYDLRTGEVNKGVSWTKSPTDAFICAFDWDECKFSTPCEAGFECINLKGDYVCNRVNCPAKQVNDGTLNVTQLHTDSSPACVEGYMPLRNASCQADGWVHNETLCVKMVTESGNGKQGTIQVLAWWKWAVMAVGIALVIAMGIGLVLWRRGQKSSSPRVGIPVPNTVNEDSGMSIYDSPYANCEVNGLYNEVYVKRPLKNTESSTSNYSNRYQGFSRKPHSVADGMIKAISTLALVGGEGEMGAAVS
ncbi:uncharacterized protein LOC135826259 [Sycon ciliatum]|uniref:uncharacterized protein LOC135826259 n=1 Tax=Sycon ciliatum TaxID=27933 RepID=UPI0031F6C8C3